MELHVTTCVSRPFGQISIKRVLFISFWNIYITFNPLPSNIPVRNMASGALESITGHGENSIYNVQRRILRRAQRKFY